MNISTNKIKAYQLKEASVKDAKATPPTIGAREKTIHGLGLCNNIILTNIKMHICRYINSCMRRYSHRETCLIYRLNSLIVEIFNLWASCLEIVPL